SWRNLLATRSGDSRLDVIAYSPDGKRLSIGSIEGFTIKVLDAVSGSEVLALDQNCAAFSPDGTQLVTGSIDGTATIRDATSGKVLRTLVLGGRSEVRGVAFHPNGKRVVTAGPEICKVWDAASGNELFGLSPPPKYIASRNWGIVYSPDGKLIANEKQVWEAGA